MVCATPKLSLVESHYAGINPYLFLPNQPTSFWQVSKIATADNILWVAQSGQYPTEILAAYHILTGNNLNTGSFVIRYQGGQVQDIH